MLRSFFSANRRHLIRGQFVRGQFVVVSCRGPYYLLSDISINVKNTSSTFSFDFDAYLKMLTSNGAFLLIDKPTRVTYTSSPIIDHIVSDDHNNILFPCIIHSGETDHFPVACFAVNDSRNHDVSRISKQPIFICD